MGGSTILVYLKISRECLNVLSIIMTSQYDDLTGKEDVQLFLKMMKEKNADEGKFGDMLDKMSPTGKKVQNFLRGDQQTEFMGGQVQPTEFMEGQQMAHDYDEDPYIRKTIMDIINTPGYDPASVKEAQRQLLRMNQGLPRFPTA